MLRFLRIRNLAVIESAEVEFDAGLNVLTGETGAGKSMLVEAVGLLLGARAAIDLVRTGETHASIEAVFTEAGERDIVIRREITTQGRSRAFVNGSAATAVVLRELAQRLVELHGQHEHQALLEPSTHLPLLDNYARLEPLAAQVASAWSSVSALRAELDRSRMDAREKSARLDLIAFQLGELEKAAPQPEEDEQLATLKQVLGSAERVQRLCMESYATLYESDHAVLAGLGGVWKRLGELATVEPRFAPYLDARDGIKSQLEDLAFFLRSYADGVDASPARLQQVEDRLALLEHLKRKYGPSLQDVIDRRAALARERALLTGATEMAEDLQNQLATETQAYLRVARELSRRRRAAAPRFSQALADLLGELAMGQSRFEVRFNEPDLPEAAWGGRGIDQAEFFLSPNPGEDVRPLGRIVSGGELSRVMLALKTLALEGQLHRAPATLVFDEVDAGIGGRVADVVGARLRQLGGQFQVLCITHLAQIAARATTQFRIDKAVKGTRTLTTVERLDEAGRVEEIARMIGGALITEPVRATARELLAGGSSPPHDGGSAGQPERSDEQASPNSSKRKAGRQRPSTGRRPT